ncbi:MAG: glycosyltransferase family 9 protein [Pyrinomonadaceae bacterium]|nr:glycosyltransferase family 9 protein [Pyrinomonadaceae bacterium]
MNNVAGKIDWPNVRRVLVVRLRSIGDTVLATPSLIALRRSLPHAEIDILLEDWVAPVLDGFEGVNVVAVSTGNAAKLTAARYLRSRRYDVAINLHGGTTSSIFVRASGAKQRVGLSHYRYPRLYDHLFSSAADFWGRSEMHSAEQQLAVLGFAGIPVADRPKSRLAVTDEALRSLEAKFGAFDGLRLSDAPSIGLIHPAAAFASKQWATGRFAEIAGHLAERGLKPVAVAAKSEAGILKKLAAISAVRVITFDDLTLPEITALSSRAAIFVGNDSGIAHIASAVGTPSVVVFGSSNRNHWHPWTDAANEIVFDPMPCQPCAGYECKVFGEPKCILNVTASAVIAAIDRVL